MIQKSTDEIEAVRTEIDDYLTNLPEYLEYAQDHGSLRINADQDAYTVFELAESKMANPIPSNFGNEDDEDQ